MRLYHRTRFELVPSIQREGFRDSAFDAEEGMERGVWFCENPCAWVMANANLALLALDVPDESPRPDWRSKQVANEWQIPSRYLTDLPIYVLSIADSDAAQQ